MAERVFTLCRRTRKNTRKHLHRSPPSISAARFSEKYRFYSIRYKVYNLTKLSTVFTMEDIVQLPWHTINIAQNKCIRVLIFDCFSVFYKEKCKNSTTRHITNRLSRIFDAECIQIPRDILILSSFSCMGIH